MGSMQPPFRLHLSKSLRRFFRTVKTEWRLFVAKPLRRRPWTVPFFITLSVLIISFLVLSLIHARTSSLVFKEPHREESHFTHDVHTFVPRNENLDTVRVRRCSWLYLEFGAKDGRFLDSFFENGNTFMEEYLRATQSSIRAFCAIAFEPDPSMLPFLQHVRHNRARKAAHFDVFTSVVPGIHNGSERVSFQTHQGDLVDPIHATSVSLRDFVLDTTFDMKDSGREIPRMSSAQGNGNHGNTILRFNAPNLQEVYWHLDTLEASKTDGVMCTRVDRIILNLQPTAFNESKLSKDMEIEDRDTFREWDKIITPPLSSKYDSKHGIEGLVEIAREVNERPGCRTTIHVIDNAGKMLVPNVISERAIHYSILAGDPTFEERVGAQTDTWMTGVPHDRVTIYTNKPRDAEGLKPARGRDTVVTQPHRPELEQRLPLMQSWSHLVRVRESWDRTMKDNPEIKWLALVDDDTFVFPGGMREYLTHFDPRNRLWAGSGEQARIDNGDGDIFAKWLREVHTKHGGKHCYLPNEDIPRQYREARVEYGISEVLNGRKVARKVSYSCGDNFCKLGCPAVPQGAAIFVSRALVEALRPHIEKCEEDTASLCKNCGSQRLYMCVNRYAGSARTLLARGICRAPWKLEHRDKFPFAITYHGFNRYHGHFLSTKSLHSDMAELWGLGKSYEEDVKQGLRSSFLVPMQKVADLIGCRGRGRYEQGICHGAAEETTQHVRTVPRAKKGGQGGP